MRTLKAMAALPVMNFELAHHLHLRIMPGVDYPCATRRQLGRLAELNAAHAAAPKGRGAQRRVIYGVEATPIVRCSLRELIVFSDVA